MEWKEEKKAAVKKENVKVRSRMKQERIEIYSEAAQHTGWNPEEWIWQMEWKKDRKRVCMVRLQGAKEKPERAKKNRQRGQKMKRKEGRQKEKLKRMMRVKKSSENRSEASRDLFDCSWRSKKVKTKRMPRSKIPDLALLLLIEQLSRAS